jgi:1-aminocyclopropane-1-carboxylate deaminase/D-cysteine desulfhydrase-like pyridoxal-dependent ACC family enzyme
MNNLPQTYVFKYKVGDVFIAKDGSIIEITGYNYNGMSYQGRVTLKDSNITINSHLIYESALNKMERYDSVSDMVEKKKKDGVNYRIHYVDLDPNKKTIKEKVSHIDITMSGIRTLAKLLNSVKKHNPNRRIVTVSIMDDKGQYIGNVKFLTKEIKEQVFLTGMKERLLAYAKYECGYEVSIGF